MTQSATFSTQGASVAVQSANAAGATAGSTSIASTPNITTTSTWQLLGFEIPSTIETLTATGVLLAFLIGFYTLIGSERKSPYLTNRLFQILLLCIPAVTFSLLAQALKTSHGWIAIAAKYMSLLAFLCLVAALIMTLWRVYKIYMRFAVFVDSAHPKHLLWFRASKHLYRRLTDHTPWEWAGTPLSDELQTKVQRILKSEKTFSVTPVVPLTSAAISLDRHGRANRILAELATAFLEENRPIQYMTASRHPFEFIQYLQLHIKNNTKLNWTAVQSKIVVADAYTRHFGYADSIYMNATTALKRGGVHHVTAGESFAGLHTASSEAFNKIKDQAQQKSGREPMLVIYEDSYALADLESREQYRVFVRHVLPSERMWQGMFTVFVETAQEQSDWELLASYCDVTLIEKAKNSE
jgi:hypothetical protein